MQRRHTKGPWQASLMPKGEWVKLEKTHELPVVMGTLVDEKGILGEIWTRNTREESEANARLMASAPELLDALEYALGLLESLPVHMLVELENEVLDEAVDFRRMRHALAAGGEKEAEGC